MDEGSSETADADEILAPGRHQGGVASSDNLTSSSALNSNPRIHPPVQYYISLASYPGSALLLVQVLPLLIVPVLSRRRSSSGNVPNLTAELDPEAAGRRLSIRDNHS